MKSWKEQLRDVKSSLRGPGGGKERGDELPKIDFEPPQAWLADDLSTPKKPSVRNTVQQPAIPTAGESSTDKPPAQLSELSLPPFKPRVKDGSALNMPEWSVTGRALQHPEHRSERSVPMTVRIGVDFGTAFTKVAIRAGVDLVPIDWSAVTGDASEGARYVVPGFVVCTPDGEFCWRHIIEADIRGNLKLPVVEMAELDECPIATVAYLALVIRFARAFLYRNTEIGRKLVGRSLRWELNIGCPTEPHENPKVVEVFRRIARTAWLLAAADRIIEQEIIVAWNSADIETGLEAEPGVIPEFVGQIAGYLVSPQVRDGLHALIDIGAATLDVATFNVVPTSENDASPPLIPIFFSAVRPLGTHYLHHNRHSKLGLDPSWSDAAPVESPEVFAQRNGKPLNKVHAADKEFVEKIVHCIKRVMDDTHTNGWGDRLSAAWLVGLPIFITGGGANCELYRRAIEQVEGHVRAVSKQLSWQSKFRFLELNPINENARNATAVGRLTVALGLTEDAENIARIVPHWKIKPVNYGKGERPDHEELYGGRS